MTHPHAWIFQATPHLRDLTVELRAGDILSWTVSRYGRELHRGDRVFYWQSGRDAGIYGVGRIAEVTRREVDGRYQVTTEHEHVLFAPVSRAEVRADPVLSALAVLRQPRGTVFPLTPEQELALIRRTGAGSLLLVVPPDCLSGRTVRLPPTTDEEIVAQVERASAAGTGILVAAPDADGASRTVSRVWRVAGLRRGRNGALVLRVQALSKQASALMPDLSPAVLDGAAAGRVAVLPAGSLEAPEPARSSSRPARAAIIAEEQSVYSATVPLDPAAIAPQLLLPDALRAAIVAALAAGRHLVLMGVPGTGKTTLALDLAGTAARAGQCSGALLATATADWTTFDTIGGLVPSADGTLRFAEGVVLRALRENRWLVLDELNRADIDKACGPLLTVLSGGPVELPSTTPEGRPIRIEPRTGPSGLSPDGSAYYAGSDWHIIATMNTLDRAALFSLSLAFARRFAFFYLPVPDRASLLALIRQRIGARPEIEALIEALLDAAPRPLGPAVVLDAAGYMAARGDPVAGGEAIGAFILPQMEGLDRPTLEAFIDALAPVLGEAGATAVRPYIDAFFGTG